jgi:hypothetical protein
MKMIRLNAVLMLALMLLLAGCGTSEKSSGDANVKSEEKETVSKEKTNEGETKETEEEDSEAEVYEASTEKEEDKASQPSENILKEKKVFKYDDDSVVITLEKAEFTTEFETSNADPEETMSNREIISDSEIFLHMTGTISNDTTDSVSFDGPLSPINFYLIYDGKHEFDMLGAAETEDGHTFETLSLIDALTERKVHIYAQVPKPLSQTDKPLVLQVKMDEETFEVPIR